MYDAIVVGARVAGAPTAMLLARKGYKVLLVDRATFPSDIMSTHFIHTEGAARLRDWGLLDQVMATGCPTITHTSFDFGAGAPAVVPLQPYDGIAETLCPRRTVLDSVLVTAAEVAGVEVRQGFSVREVLVDGDRVTGIRGRAANGDDVVETATIVVGADGMHSIVANAVQAPEYNEAPSASCAYYSYWSGMELGPIEFYFREKRAVLLFPTNNGQACIAAYWPGERFHEVRADIEGSFWREIDAIPTLSARMRAGTRDGRFIGTADLRNFYRRPFGNGWALAGDAGYHKDPILGWGITDAFRDADFLAEALDASFSGRAPIEAALAGYESKRNAVTAEMYRATLWFASLPAPADIAQAMMGGRPADAEALA